MDTEELVTALGRQTLYRVLYDDGDCEHYILPELLGIVMLRTPRK